MPPAATAVGGGILAGCALIGMGFGAKAKYDACRKQWDADEARRAREKNAGAVTVGVYRHGDQIHKIDWLRPLLPKLEDATEEERTKAIFVSDPENECLICAENLQELLMYLPCGHVVSCCDCNLVLLSTRLTRILNESFEDAEVITKQFILDLISHSDPKKRLQISCPYCRTPVQDARKVKTTN